jgi:hypothetical protein
MMINFSAKVQGLVMVKIEKVTELQKMATELRKSATEKNITNYEVIILAAQTILNP